MSSILMQLQLVKLNIPLGINANIKLEVYLIFP